MNTCRNALTALLLTCGALWTDPAFAQSEFFPELDPLLRQSKFKVSYGFSDQNQNTETDGTNDPHQVSQESYKVLLSKDFEGKTIGAESSLARSRFEDVDSKAKTEEVTTRYLVSIAFSKSKDAFFQFIPFAMASNFALRQDYLDKGLDFNVLVHLERNTSASVDNAGLAVKLGGLSLLYLNGKETAVFRAESPGQTTISERYTVDFLLRGMGLDFGKPKNTHMRLVWRQFDIPGATGNTYDAAPYYRNRWDFALGKGEEEKDWGITYALQFGKAFQIPGLYESKGRVEEVKLRFGLTDSLVLSFAHRRTKSQQLVALFGHEFDIRDRSTEYSTGLEWHFDKK